MNESGNLLHYIHPTHAIGDVHPFYHQGTLYLYYLKPGGKYEAVLLRSNDLLTWEETPIVHEADELYPPLRPYFVLGIYQDESRGLFRSYFGSDNVMRGSVSEDLLTWRAAGEACNVPAQPGYSVLRDPFLFWNEEEQLYWVIMTARKGGSNNGPNGGIAYASSPDLQTWTPRGDLYFDGDMGDPECPEMFRIGGKWYLLFSVYNHAVGRPRYLVSDRSTGPWTAMEPDCLDGSDLAAAQTIAWGQGRLMFGWIPLQDKETLGHQYWGGHLALPREIYQDGDGALASRLERTVAERVRGERLLAMDGKLAVHAAGEAAVLPGVYERIDMELGLIWEDGCERAVISLHEDGMPQATDISFERDGRGLTIATDSAVHSDMSVRQFGSCTRIRLLAEADMVELFVDERYSLAARISVKLAAFQVKLSAGGESGVLAADIGIYRLNTR